MAGKSDALEAAWLDLFFLGTGISEIADNTATSPATEYYLALHTGDPTDSGTQTSNECTYGDYARVAVARSGAGFSRSGSSVTLVADAVFPAASSGSETVTHFSLGADTSGAGVLYYAGAVTPNIPVSTPIQPRLTTGTSFTED